LKRVGGGEIQRALGLVTAKKGRRKRRAVGFNQFEGKKNRVRKEGAEGMLHLETHT